MMKRCLFTLLLIVDVACLFCYGQDSEISIERAESFSRMAEFYYTANNYDKAIEYESQALRIQDSIFGNNSIQYASSAQNIAKYYYSRGNEKDDVNSRSDFNSATRYLTIAINTIKNTLLDGFFGTDSQSKYQIWQGVNNLFDSMFPSYVVRYPNDSTISCLYNTVLFSKGITWRNESILYANWKDIQSNLQDDEIAIEFISPVTPDNENVCFYALSLKKDYEAPHITGLFDIWQLQDSLNSCSSKEGKDLKLGRMVWGTMSKELVNSQKIFFSPTHVLHNIAIEYSPINNHEFYFDNYEFYRLSSTLELTKAKNPRRYQKAVLYGGLDYGTYPTENRADGSRSGLDPLYNTQSEIQNISDILKEKKVECVLYSGVRGNESSFKNLSKQGIDILHIATHGKWETVGIPHNQDQALLGSYLALSGANYLNGKDDSDGVITAYEISNIDFNHTGLVVLSACESALGEYGFDDGLIGLQRGFKIAGANTILMSIDKVDDEATRILMVEFYRNLMSGKTKHQSLKDAQKYLRSVDDGKYNDPKYWASFIMLDGLN